MNYDQLAQQIKIWGQELGFDQVGICDVDLKAHEEPLQKWLDAGNHGTMDWMARHGMMRARPDVLLPGTMRVISARMSYLPPEAQFASNLSQTDQAYISRYALGRDYHKLVRKQLNKLGQQIAEHVASLGFRPFVDSAPILERPLAEKAGLGWRGKHSLLINQSQGSWFFLGELLVDIPLPVDTPSQNQCGKCQACITSCPTGAITSEGVVDSRRCISYLTIEFDGVIPEEFRSAMGNRIYGCDDCQLVCPWNREAPLTQQTDFHRRKDIQQPDLIELFAWDEAQFLKNMEGSAIRRIGHQQWLRNLSVAMGNSIATGNANYHERYITALTARLGESELLDIHIQWAIKQQRSTSEQISTEPTIHEPQQSSHKQSRKQQRLIRIIEKGLPRDA